MTRPHKEKSLSKSCEDITPTLFMSSTIIIMGGGLTGLSYAYNVVRNGDSAIIIERDILLGGLLKTFNFNGFLFDIGPKIFRSKDEKVLNFVKELLNNNYHSVSSNPSIFKYGKFFDNVIPIVTFRNIECLPSKLKENVKKELRDLKNRNLNFNNFEECIRSQIGETLYWEFFGEYTQKFWGIEPRNLSADLAPKKLRIGGEKLYAHITTGFEKPSEEIYPTNGGIHKIIEGLADKVSSAGAEFLTGANVKGLEVDGNEISKVVIEKGVNEIEIATTGKLVVSTIPLTVLCKMLGIKASLGYRALLCIFIKLRSNRLLNYSWVYFPEHYIVFVRIHEPAYYSIYNVPKGYSSLCIEVTCFENDANWQDKYIGEKAVEQLMDVGIIRKSQEPEVVGIEKFPYAYPIYTIDYKQKLEEVFSKLILFKNLKVIGRTGSFRYLNMWECLKWAVY
jgi:protoporphyrinogen oxidase